MRNSIKESMVFCSFYSKTTSKNELSRHSDISGLVTKYYKNGDFRGIIRSFLGLIRLLSKTLIFQLYGNFNPRKNNESGEEGTGGSVLVEPRVPRSFESNSKIKRITGNAKMNAKISEINKINKFKRLFFWEICELYLMLNTPSVSFYIWVEFLHNLQMLMTFFILLFRYRPY